MKILICTDLEGISGVCVWEQTRDRTSALYQDARRLLMGDIAAAVEGCLEGGAEDIIVSDGHGGGFNIAPEMMHPRARYFTGRNRRPLSSWAEMYQGVDGAILLGYHAMAGTSDGILRHTQSSLGGNRYWYNGRECGEIAQSALLYGHYGIPIVMVTGDTAAVREARAFLGEEIVTVAVKQSFGEEFGLLLSPEAAHEAIRVGAREAIARCGACQPFTMDLPIQGRLRLGDKVRADAHQPRRARRVDDCTYEAVFDSALEIYEF